jgi:hypothetical protein
VQAQLGLSIQQRLRWSPQFPSCPRWAARSIQPSPSHQLAAPQYPQPKIQRPKIQQPKTQQSKLPMCQPSQSVPSSTQLLLRPEAVASLRSLPHRWAA